VPYAPTSCVNSAAGIYEQFERGGQYIKGELQAIIVDRRTGLSKRLSYSAEASCPRELASQMDPVFHSLVQGLGLTQGEDSSGSDSSDSEEGSSSDDYDYGGQYF